jgi:hypothetical protein
MIDYPEPSRIASPRWGVILALTFGLVLVAGPVIALTSGPPDGFSGQIATLSPECGYGCFVGLPHTQSIPKGVNVSFSWSDQSGGSVLFVVESPGLGELRACFWSDAGAGSCSFTSIGGNYSFHAQNSHTEDSQLIDFSGTYRLSAVYVNLSNARTDTIRR